MSGFQTQGGGGAAEGPAAAGGGAPAGPQTMDGLLQM